MEATHAEIQEAANAIEIWKTQFAHRDKSAKRHLMIAGQVGTGKSHMADRMHFWSRRIAIFAWEKHWWPHPPQIEIAEWAKVTFLPFDEWKKWIDGLHNTDILFLEDVGAEVDRFKSGEPTERFREVLNDFKDKWLFITTNVMPEQWVTRWDERVQDRLLRNSKVISLRNAPRFNIT